MGHCELGVNEITKSLVTFRLKPQLPWLSCGRPIAYCEH